MTAAISRSRSSPAAAGWVDGWRLPRQTDSGGHQRVESIPVAPGSRGVQTTGAPAVIAARRLQRQFADGFIAEAVEDLWEPWMRHADKRWKMTPCCSSSSKRWPNAARRARLA